MRRVQRMGVEIDTGSHKVDDDDDMDVISEGRWEDRSVKEPDEKAYTIRPMSSLLKGKSVTTPAKRASKSKPLVTVPPAFPYNI
jgi:hypothetical protein